MPVAGMIEFCGFGVGRLADATRIIVEPLKTHTLAWSCESSRGFEKTRLAVKVVGVLLP